MQDGEARIKESFERMHASAEKAIQAIADRNWDALIIGIVGTAEEFRGAMALCGELPSEKRMNAVRDCGREHHAAKARIALALKKAFEKSGQC